MEANGRLSIRFPTWVVQGLVYIILSLLSAVVTYVIHYTSTEFKEIKQNIQAFKDDVAEVHSDVKSRLLLQEYRQTDMRRALDEFTARLQEWDRDVHGYPPIIRRKTERPNQ